MKFDSLRQLRKTLSKANATGNVMPWSRSRSRSSDNRTKWFPCPVRPVRPDGRPFFTSFLKYFQPYFPSAGSLHSATALVLAPPATTADKDLNFLLNCARRRPPCNPIAAMAASCSFSACKPPELMQCRKASGFLPGSVSRRVFQFKPASLSAGGVEMCTVSTEIRGCSVRCSALETRILNPFTAGNSFQLDDVIEAQQFDRDILNAIFDVAREMEKIEKNSMGSRVLKGYLMSTLFYEPSTRTRLSFESAMKRLGGEVLTTENAREFSSAAKGETLEDTIRTVEGYSDIIVMRHFESGAAKRAAATAGIPVINAGDGPGQHPTQALLDMYTVDREIGKLDGITVALVGDLAHGRTVRSLAYLLAKYNDVKIYFVSPDVVRMKDDIKEYLSSMGVKWEESSDLLEVASKCDIVYQTRIQRERFGERTDLYEEARGKYIVDKNVLNSMQEHAVVMHPLPRLDEITVDVDADPRAAYFRQAKNGLYIRMALLKLLLIGW